MLKQDKIGEFEYVLRYHDNAYNSQNVQCQIRKRDLNLDEHKSIDVTVSDANGEHKIADYRTDTYGNGSGFTLPTNIIESNELVPGQKVKISLYEYEDTTDTDETEDEFVDDGYVLDRVEAVSDSSATDNVDSRLRSEKVHRYLGGLSKEFAFKNVQTGKTATATVSPNNERNTFTFPHQVREAIEVSPDDLIEIRLPESENDELSTSEKIDEIHEMISELYDAYTND